MGVLVSVLSYVLQIVRMAAMVIAVMDVTIGAMEAANWPVGEVALKPHVLVIV